MLYGFLWTKFINIYMENYLLRKTNRIRPSRSLYDNPFRNDNSLKNICQRNTKPLCQNCDRCDGCDNSCENLFWHLILMDFVHFWISHSPTWDENSEQKLKKSIKIKCQNRVSQELTHPFFRPPDCIALWDPILVLNLNGFF